MIKFKFKFLIFLFIILLNINSQKIYALNIYPTNSSINTQPIMVTDTETIQDDVNTINLTSNKEKDPIVSVFNHSNKKVYLTNKDIDLMAKVVFAESKGESYNGKLAVASVILNRATSSSFPSTINDVIKQKNAFSCVINGEIKGSPNEECYKAVMDAINGKDPTNSALYFYNPKISSCNWMKGVNKKNIKVIGNHVFFQV